MRRTAGVVLVAGLFTGLQDPQYANPATAEIRDATDRAVRWLLLAQNEDGSWGDNPKTPGEIGNTCIATLALMATGSTATRGEHWVRIRRARAWLAFRAKGWGTSSANLDRQTLLQRKLGDNIDLYLLTLLHSQALGTGVVANEEDVVRRELGSAVDRIASMQKANGEWEASYEPILTTISAWLALRQAHDAGITIRHASAKRVVDYLKDTCLDRKSGVFRDKKWGNTMRFVTQAGGLRVLYGMGEGDSPEAVHATRVLMAMTFSQDVGGREGGEEFLGALFATQALHIERDQQFCTWYRKCVGSLLAVQNRDGSWTGHHCITGRVFCTACSILTMLTPDQTLPMVDR